MLLGNNYVTNPRSIVILLVVTVVIIVILCYRSLSIDRITVLISLLIALIYFFLLASSFGSKSYYNSVIYISIITIVVTSIILFPSIYTLTTLLVSITTLMLIYLTNKENFSHNVMINTILIISSYCLLFNYMNYNLLMTSYNFIVLIFGVLLSIILILKDEYHISLVTIPIISLLICLDRFKDIN